jgi:hypothetical protein
LALSLPGFLFLLKISEHIRVVEVILIAIMDEFMEERRGDGSTGTFST